MIGRFYAFLLAILITPASTTGSVDPADAAGWFQRAATQMNLRATGSAPFHMRVTFHAYPGVEMTKKPQIITGDGVYEETWLSPRKWRREVTFGTYHAVEVQSSEARKMQASSDYEPSRILMLLEGLFNPIPRNYLDPTLNDVPLSWKIEHTSAQGMNFVRVSRHEFGLTRGSLGHQPIAAAYNFLPGGLLVLGYEEGITTGWQDEVDFSGKAVPRHFTIVAIGGKLLDAEVSVAEVSAADAGKVNENIFDLPTTQADPGMTLRPLHQFETRGLRNLDGGFSFVVRNPASSRKVLREIVDRHGVVREAEIIDAEDLASAGNFLDAFRTMHWKPAKLDASPCEVVFSTWING